MICQSALFALALIAPSLMALKIGLALGKSYGEKSERRRWLYLSSAEREAERLRHLNGCRD